MLRLAAIRHLTFGVNPERPGYPGVTDLFAERSAPYGVEVDPTRPLTGNRNSYARMSGELLPGLTAGVDPDAVVLAHAIPDCDLSTSVSGYLEQRIGGQPLVFAVTEQGRTTPFAALGLARDLFRAGTRRRIAVLALDQGSIVYPDPALADLDRDADHAVGLLFSTDGSIRITALRHRTRVGPDQAAPVLAALLDGLAPAGDVTLVTGARVPPVEGPYRRRRAGTDQLCTGVWAGLADELGRPHPRHRTVLAVEYEPALGYLCLAGFDVPPSEGLPR